MLALLLPTVRRQAFYCPSSDDVKIADGFLGFLDDMRI